MFNRFAIRLVKFLMSRDLTVEERNSLVINILDNLDVLPIHGIIDYNSEGELLLSGRSLDIEKVTQLREASRTALNNVALKLVSDEVLFTAITQGVHKVENPLQMLFYRAAIWYSQQQQEFLKKLAQINN